MEIETLCLESRTTIKWQHTLSLDNGYIHAVARTTGRMECTLFFLWLQFSNHRWKASELSRYSLTEKGKEYHCICYKIPCIKRKGIAKDTGKIVGMLYEFISSKWGRHSSWLWFVPKIVGYARAKENKVLPIRMGYTYSKFDDPTCKRVWLHWRKD